ncbi:hypothetical protein HYX05_01130 [Candidatus Woesearchaeota archaeon]|nr:hypothetical protein [Candidatus Woesearchaeota archaeon]
MAVRYVTIQREKIVRKNPKATKGEVDLAVTLEYILSFHKLTEAGKMIVFGYRPHLAQSHVNFMGRALELFLDLDSKHWIKRNYSELEVEQAYLDIRDYYQKNKLYFDMKEKEADAADEWDKFLRTA